MNAMELYDDTLPDSYTDTERILHALHRFAYSTNNPDGYPRLAAAIIHGAIKDYTNWDSNRRERGCKFILSDTFDRLAMQLCPGMENQLRSRLLKLRPYKYVRRPHDISDSG